MKKIIATLQDSTLNRVRRHAETLFSEIKASNDHAKALFEMYKASHFPDSETFTVEGEPHVAIYREHLEGLTRSFGLIHGVSFAKYNRQTGEIETVFEESFGGIDRVGQTDITSEDYKTYTWVEPDLSRIHRVQSITKSISSILLAMACVERGLSPDCLLRSLSNFISDSEVDRIGTLTLEQKAKIKENMARVTLGHILNMTTGLEGPSSFLSFPKEYELYPTWTWALLSDYNETQVGKKMIYSDGDAMILGKIIEALVEKPTLEFAEDKLFGPRDIAAVGKYWKDPKKDLPDFFSCSGGLSLKMADLIKIGQFMLEETSLELAPWLEKYQTPIFPDLQRGSKLKGYGHYFWFYEDPRLVLNGKPLEVILFSGVGGQRLFILKELDILMATQGGFYKASGEREERLLYGQSTELFYQFMSKYLERE